MSNMSYCRFQNTLSDLRDCYHAMDEADYNADDAADYEQDGDMLSEAETVARRELLELCKKIVDQYGE